MHDELMHPADQLVTIMRRIYSSGLTTLSGGNLSIRSADGCVWVTPGGVDKGSLTRQDMVLVHPDGSAGGFRKPTSELLMHQAIYNCCDQIRAVLHAHSPALGTFSFLRRVPDVFLIPNACLVCGPVGLAPYERMGSAELAESVARLFQKGHAAVILENHGVCVGAPSLSQAYMIFETLEFAARSELLARRLGPVHALSKEQIDLARTKAHVRMGDFYPKNRSDEELAARRDMASLIQRAIEQQLFISSNGTFSQRLGDGSFLITPYGQDRRWIREENLVLIKRGMKEAGKVPSRAVFLHELIYRRQPAVKAIIGAHPQHLMAFTLTDQMPATNLMPESYVMLKKLPRYPYGLNYREPQKTAELFSQKTPAILLEHDGILVTGKTMLQAFDRFEVAEFMAKAQLSVPPGLQPHPLSDAQLAELNDYFPE